MLGVGKWKCSEARWKGPRRAALPAAFRPAVCMSDRSDAARAVTRLGESNSKLKGGSCEDLGKESIKCIEEHGYNRNDPACKVHFDAYRECRKAENAANSNRRQLKSLFFN